MIDSKSLTAVRTILEDLSKLSVENLVKKPEWGAINFEMISSELGTSILLASHLNQLPIERIPQSNFQNLLQITQQLGNRISVLQAFDISKSGNPVNDRNNISNQLRSDCDNFTLQCTQWIPLLSYLHGDTKAQFDAINSMVVKSNTLLEDTKKSVAARNEEIDKVIATARETAGKAGVSIYATDFKQAASDASAAAKKWLIATVVAGVLTIVTLGILLGFMLWLRPTGELFWQLIVTKIVIASIFLAATLWCGRMFKAYKHQEAMNAFRSNALRTFQSFIAASGDQQSKDAVLLETTRAIFSITPTGYLDGHGETKEPAVTIMEVIRQGMEAGRK